VRRIDSSVPRNEGLLFCNHGVLERKNEEEKMNLEGTACGACNKGKLHKIMDEVSKGVFVEAYKCGSCGEIAYSEEVMRKIEAMEKKYDYQFKVVFDVIKQLISPQETKKGKIGFRRK